MGGAVVLSCPHPTGTRPPFEIFAELARRGEQLTIYADGTYRAAVEEVGATYRTCEEVTGDSPAARPDYVVLDAAAPCGLEAARLLRLPTVSYRDVCPLECDTCRCDLNLVLIARVLQADAERFDRSYRFVGRCADDRPEEDSPWHKLRLHPLIYISPAGVLRDRGAFLRACAEAFGGLTFEVVAEGKGEEWPSVPSNFQVVPAVALRKLLARTTLAISGADPDTVEECARAGVPHLMYPQSAQAAMLAARVEELGAGLRLTDADLRGGRLRDGACDTMADPRYCRAAEALTESVRRSGGAALACDEILAFVGRRGAALY